MHAIVLIVSAVHCVRLARERTIGGAEEGEDWACSVQAAWSACWQLAGSVSRYFASPAAPAAPECSVPGSPCAEAVCVGSNSGAPASPASPVACLAAAGFPVVVAYPVVVADHGVMAYGLPRPACSAACPAKPAYPGYGGLSCEGESSAQDSAYSEGSAYCDHCCDVKWELVQELNLA